MADLNATQVRDALAWATNNETSEEPDETPWEWFWVAIQGDFNENRSTKQILTDAAISMIPGIDQICDIRDLIANCRKLYRDATDTFAWVALALTLIGLFPTLGSLVKGVLKIFFSFITRMAGANLVDSVEQGLSSVVTFLRRREVQKYLQYRKIDDVFLWVAKSVEDVRDRVELEALLAGFDNGIKVLDALVEAVRVIPKIGTVAKNVLDEIRRVRLKADDGLRSGLVKVVEIMDAIIHVLKQKSTMFRHGILNVENVHFRGALPEATAVTLMQKPNALPKWMNDGIPTNWKSASYLRWRSVVANKVKHGWPPLDQRNIESFHRLIADEIKGPARMIRIIAPNSRSMGDCWISEEVFKRIQSSPDPRTAWRRYLAVWPDWNVNGQFVVYDIKRGESLKVWRGEAARQLKTNVADRYLEGGYEQIIFKLSRSDLRNDTMKYYKQTPLANNKLGGEIDQQTYDALGQADKDTYIGIRATINHPNISGPYETGWGYIDFDGLGFLNKVGLPELSAQTTVNR